MTGNTAKTDDASGRGKAEGFVANFPSMLRTYSEAEIDAVVRVMRNAEAQTQGEHMRKFQKDFREYTGARHAFAVDNCTNALRLAAILRRLQPGDEVIIPAYTFCATAIPFGMTGAKIVWSDIDRDTWVADPRDIERKVTSKTKAVVVTHLLGMPVDMEAVLKVAEQNGLFVVEDCAQAPGARIGGRSVGTFGHFGCFSFHSAKNMTTLGEGGMLTVREDADAELVPGLRHNGTRAYGGTRERYWVPAMSDVDTDMDGVWPNNFCIGEAQCALGSEELKSLDGTADTLIAQARRIREGLSALPEITMATVPEGFRHIYHQFVLHYDGSKTGRDRNELLDILTGTYKIRAIVQYYPLYRYPLFRKLGAGEQSCPVLEDWWDNSFSLPWWCGIPGKTIDYMVSSLKTAVEELRR